MSERDADDFDAPEEFTSEQGIQQDEEIRKVQRESNARIVREGKNGRRKWAERLTPRPPQNDEVIKKEVEAETRKGSDTNGGMLPEDIVSFLASREKQVFLSDTEEEKPVKKLKKKTKRPKKSGVEPVILKDIPPAHCLQNSLEFLKKRKMQVSRSSAVLNNSNQALRLLSTSGLLNRAIHQQGFECEIEFVQVLMVTDASENDVFVKWLVRGRYDTELAGDDHITSEVGGCFLDMVKSILSSVLLNLGAAFRAVTALFRSHFRGHLDS
ncbi:hypothetical protein Nepgr_008280 [Nepenthes gracilis]|uniref:Uncharacterized protein n=1 Tax=Nepenthes gracilis TaxID=150966 RepID=A0AAD3S8G0_NEPGR|nr:hypothetical protein Nepgr_008280 [Nepenthes gracilis]